MAWLKIFLIIYMILFGLVCFAWRVYIVSKKTGFDALSLASPDEPSGFIELLFKPMVLLVVVTVVAFIFFPSAYERYFLPYSFDENRILKAVGVLILVLSLIFCAFSQATMGASWRIGIDKHHKTELVNQGIFRYSRNPIYFSMVLTAAGLFFVLPNQPTLLILILTYILLQIKIRLEEQHMRHLHGQAYLDYCSKVRRWI